jgi:hypothetical protein
MLPLSFTTLRSEWYESIVATDASPSYGCVVTAPLDPARASSFLRAVDFRGARVNLSFLPSDDWTLVPTKKGGLQTSFDPRGLNWKMLFRLKFKYAAHITLKEAAIQLAFLRTVRTRNSKIFCLPDNRPHQYAVAKGRSGSPALNMTLRKVCGVCVAKNLYVFSLWTSTHLQPADYGTRAGSFQRALAKRLQDGEVSRE